MSNARSVDPQPIPTVRYNRIAAVGAWLVGVFFTYLALSLIAPDAPVLVRIGIAIGGQALLTLAQRPLWRWALRRKHGRFVALAAAATLLDGLINAGGMYSYMPRLAKTDTGRMLIEVFGLSPNVSNQAAAGLALAFGILLGGLPEYLYEMDA